VSTQLLQPSCNEIVLYFSCRVNSKSEDEVNPLVRHPKAITTVPNKGNGESTEYTAFIDLLEDVPSPVLLDSPQSSVDLQQSLFQATGDHNSDHTRSDSRDTGVLLLEHRESLLNSDDSDIRRITVRRKHIFRDMHDPNLEAFTMESFTAFEGNIHWRTWS
jgi:hypothetical protein